MKGWIGPAVKDAARDDSSSPAGAPQPAAGGMGAAGATEREPRSGGERVLRAELGFLGGLGCGFTPGCGLVHQVGVETKLLGRGDTHSAVGWSLGVTAGGLFLTALGGLGDVAGGALSLSGVGAVLGVPVAVVATGAVVGGLANAGAGIRGLMSSGSGGSSGTRVTGAELEAKRAEFDRKVRPAFWRQEAKTNPNQYSQENLALMRQGSAPEDALGRPIELHHIKPLSQGGTNEFSNLRIMTRAEHRLGPNYRANHPRFK